MKAKDFQALQFYAEKMDGVLTMPDIKVLFAKQGEPAIFKKLKEFLREGALIKVKRGVYAVPSASLDVVSQRIEPDSYITAGAVLAREMVIGSIPTQKVHAAKIGRPRIYKCGLGIIEHLSLKRELYFGFASRNGVKYACPEKAFLDACYFYFKGRRFSFDLSEDVDVSALDGVLMAEYLRAYDRRFIGFFRKRWMT